MNCAQCGARTKVLDTRGTVRRRACLENPSHIFETTERVSHIGARPQGRPLGRKNQDRRWAQLK